MFQANYGQWEILGTCSLDSFHRIRVAGYPVCQEHGKAIRRNDDDSYIDLSTGKPITKMNHVHDQEIAPAGELNLNA